MKYLAMNKANEHSDLGMEGGGGGGGGGGSISHWKPPLPKAIHLKKKTTAITEVRSFPTGDTSSGIRSGRVLRRISLHCGR